MILKKIRNLFYENKIFDGRLFIGMRSIRFLHKKL